MAFDVYNLNDLQIELGYFASDVGQSFNEGKFLRIQQAEFDNKPEGNGKALLDEGIQTNMVRKTKSGAYALVAKQVQQIVSVHDRPSNAQSHNATDSYDDDVYSQFEALDEEGIGGGVKSKDQPILTYLGAGLAIMALLLSSLVSATGLTGIFTVILAVAGFIMTVIGTIQFFRSATTETRSISKVMHIVLTVISFLAVIMLSLTTFVLAPAVQERPTEVQADVAFSPEKDVDSASTLSLDELKETVEFTHTNFSVSTDEAGILRTGLSVTLANTTDSTWTYDITIQAYNTNGDKVGDPDFILMTQVAPDEPVEYTLFEYITKEEADILSQEGMTFKIDDIKAI